MLCDGLHNRYICHINNQIYLLNYRKFTFFLNDFEQLMYCYFKLGNCIIL